MWAESCCQDGMPRFIDTPAPTNSRALRVRMAFTSSCIVTPQLHSFSRDAATRILRRAALGRPHRGDQLLDRRAERGLHHPAQRREELRPGVALRLAPPRLRGGETVLLL